MGSTHLPDPSLPMSYLAPELASMMMASAYFVTGTLGALIWDMLCNAKEDYQLMRKHKWALPNIVYATSKFWTLTYVVIYALYATAPLGRCRLVQKILSTAWTCAIPLTSLLFFFRVQAVWNRDKYITSFFTVSWLAVVGGCITVFPGVSGINIGPTKYCMNNPNIMPYVSAAVIAPLIYDSLVFIFISWKLMRNCHEQLTLTSGIERLVWGAYMPAFSKGVLHDGQLYYLSTLVLQLLSIIMVLGNTSIAYKSMFAVPSMALMNMMAGRVYRGTRRNIPAIELSNSPGNSSASNPLPPLTFSQAPIYRQRERIHTVVNHESNFGSATKRERGFQSNDHHTSV